jgi:cysteinyl-tRNA synthetase
MAMKYLGETLDIHAGGIDLTFPHHENEIAQSEALTGKPFARFWLHSEHLIVEGQKMSKSLGNFYTLRDLLERGYAPETIRYLLASVPYRKKLNFTFDGLKAAATAIERLRNYKLRLDTAKFAAGKNDAIEKRTAAALEQFDSSLDDDLNTAEALAAIFEYVRDTNSAMDAGEFLEGNSANAAALIARFDSIFDVLNATQSASAITDEEVEQLIAERQAARKAKNFKRSDEIRAELTDRGIVLEDTKDGVRWKRK